MHLLHIAIVFWGVNYCILQYSIAFLAAIAIAIAIVLMAIANALIPIIDYEAHLIKVERYSIYIRTYSMGWQRILFFAPDYIFLCENWFSKRLAMVHDFPPWLTYSNEIDIQLSWKYPSVQTIMKNIVFPYTRWIMTKKIIRLVSCF